jgi:DNA mismatch repair protein MutL
MSKEEREKFRTGGFHAPTENYDPLFNPFDTESSASGKKGSGVPGTIGVMQGEQIVGEGGEKKFLQIKGDFLVTASDNGLLLIDIQRAYGKIAYEKYLNSLVHAKPAIQEELFPKTVDMDHASFSVLMSNTERLKSLGFDIREFGKDCILVYGTPSDFNGEKINIEDFIANLAEELEDEENQAENGDGQNDRFDIKFREKIALDAIRHSNFSLKSAMTDIEANALVNELLACKDPAIYPLGGYCMTTVTADELKKKLL